MAELAATYAALILADDGLEITADKITTLLTTAKVEIEPIWATLLAKALEGKDVKDMLSNVGAGGGAAAPAAAVAAASGGEAAAPKAEEKKVEEKEESDDDMGFGLFDCKFSSARLLVLLRLTPFRIIYPYRIYSFDTSSTWLILLINALTKNEPTMKTQNLEIIFRQHRSFHKSSDGHQDRPRPLALSQPSNKEHIWLDTVWTTPLPEETITLKGDGSHDIWSNHGSAGSFTTDAL
ncbi:hypothetical protein MJO28_007121 [Puccinia striiformis f. sp. tritici]|uniref:Uncharacterized protein n=1 Tax=Puccinia striiformis f. sp. tritici TaxID=168172 RepID=A0ACC0ED43_9BASI|nr:hypothetical protein MJO28_007121 [Puccinia striiformis f. sp. tritici]